MPGAGGVATLIPLSGFLDDFLGVIDHDPTRRRRNAHTPLSYPHSAYRTTAINRGVRLLRYGDEFIEAVKSFSDLDDRGRSYAMWRQFYDEFSDNPEPQMCFRFDFLIESRLDDAVTVLENSSLRDNNSAHSILARRGDALFPPSVAHVWLDEEGEELEQEIVDKLLVMPYEKKGVTGHYIDTNLKLRRFLSLIKALPDNFANWGERCRRMRDQALSILLLRQELLNKKKAAIKRAQSEDEIRFAQLETRIRHLDGKEAESERAQLALEIKINEALYNGIRTPSIKVDVVGVVFLSSQPFSSIEQAVEDLT